LSFEFEKEGIKLALRSIRERKLRSFLTIIGIVIGIAAIISMMSIGEGTNQYVQEQFEQLGSNKIIISTFTGMGPESMFGAEELKEKDVALVKSVRGVELSIPILYKTLSTTYKDTTISSFVFGMNSNDAKDIFEGSQFEIRSGRWIRPGDKYTIVLGSMASKENFGKELKVRDSITIEDRSFEIIGVMEEVGNSQDDSQIYMTLETLREITGEEEEISAIFAQAYDVKDVEEVADRIQQKLDNKYGEDVFAVMSTSTLANQVSSMMSAISIALGGIASIALVVAGIGIANTMYMSILERTKEIGIMKSIGATNTDILKIFLIEAAMIGLIGGIIGLAAGTGLSNIIGYALESQGLPLKTVVSVQLASLGFFFSIVVGVLSGVLPARKAAQLNPIDALRYE